MAKYKIGKCRFFGTNKKAYPMGSIVDSNGPEMEGMSDSQINNFVSDNFLIPIVGKNIKPDAVRHSVTKKILANKKGNGRK